MSFKLFSFLFFTTREHIMKDCGVTLDSDLLKKYLHAFSWKL